MNQSEPIRIGLPVFNGEPHLQDAIESLLHQTYENFQIFVVDNASTDGTSEIIQRYAQKDSRIKYFRQNQWLKATANWNRTYALAAPGVRFFMWASDDDLFAKDYIESLLPPLLEDSKVVLSFPQVDVIDQEGKVVAHLYREVFPSGRSPFQRIRSIIRSGRFSAIYGLLRNDAIRRAPVMVDTSFGADLWFLMQLATAGDFYLVKRPLFFKRTGGISETREDPSTSYDPFKTWEMGAEEWRLLGGLGIGYLAKLYMFYRLKLLGKAFDPQSKRIDWFLWPMFWSYMFWKEPRSMGVRTKLRVTF